MHRIMKCSPFVHRTNELRTQEDRRYLDTSRVLECYNGSVWFEASPLLWSADRASGRAMASEGERTPELLRADKEQLDRAAELLKGEEPGFVIAVFPPELVAAAAGSYG